jgi:hypothetical protein
VMRLHMKGGHSLGTSSFSSRISIATVMRAARICRQAQQEMVQAAVSVLATLMVGHQSMHRD